MNSRKVNWFYLIIVVLHIGLIAWLTISAINGIYINIPIIPNLLLSQGMIFIPALLFALFSKEKLNDIFRFHKIKISTVLMIILFTELMLPLTTVINAISMLFVDNAVVQMSGSVLAMPMPVMLLFMGVLGPVSEEIVCRGFVLSGYKRSGNTFFAILFSALLFGLMHMNFNQAAYAIFLGIVMAVLVEATGSLWSSIVFHMTVNIQNVVLMFVSDNMYSEEYMQEAQTLTGNTESMLAVIGIYSVIAAVTTSIAVCILVWIAKNEKRDIHLKQIWTERKINRGRMVTVPFILGIVLSVAYMVLGVII